MRVSSKSTRALLGTRAQRTHRLYWFPSLPLKSPTGQKHWEPHEAPPTCLKRHGLWQTGPDRRKPPEAKQHLPLQRTGWVLKEKGSRRQGPEGTVGSGAGGRTAHKLDTSAQGHSKQSHSGMSVMPPCTSGYRSDQRERCTRSSGFPSPRPN